jgi:hypothetical protein
MWGHIMMTGLVDNKLERLQKVADMACIVLGTTRCLRIMLPHCTSLFDIVNHDSNGRHFENNIVDIVTVYGPDD